MLSLMTPKPDYLPIQGLWVSGKLSPMEQTCIRSFLKHGHEFVLYTYDAVEGIPDGTTVRDARDIVSQAELDRFLKKFNGQLSAGFSDLFRYYMLHKTRGWWVDMDVVCLRPFETPSEPQFASTYEHGWGECPTGCVMTYGAGSELSQWFVTEAQRLFDETPDGVMGLAIGPFLVQRAVKELELQRFVAPWWKFNPFFWKGLNRIVYPAHPRAYVSDLLRQAKQRAIGLFDAKRPAPYIRSETWAVHLYNDIWRGFNLSKWDTFHKACVYEKLKHQFA